MGTENKLIKDIIWTEEQIGKRLTEIASEIDSDFPDGIIILPIMDGGLVPATDLSKKLKIDVTFDFIKSSSYVEDKKVSEPRIIYEANKHIKDLDVLIVDDLIDSGETVKKVIEIIESYKPKSISLMSTLAKSNRIKTGVKEYIGWEREDNEFLIGYGLDWNGMYRNLPFIASVKKGE